MNKAQNMYAHLQTLADGRARRIDGVKGQPATWHLWKNAEINAITLALAAGRPLLVRGEPGTGKSQLARAAASALGWALHTATLHVRSEPQDLLYQFDAVRRLADAQANNLKDENRYWQPQALWKALDWDSAHDYGALLLARENGNKPPAPTGHVVLIDEIDKAPSDVPNGLLEVLGARCFEIPGIPLLVSPQVAAGAGAQAHGWVRGSKSAGGRWGLEGRMEVRPPPGAILDRTLQQDLHLHAGGAAAGAGVHAHGCISGGKIGWNRARGVSDTLQQALQLGQGCRRHMGGCRPSEGVHARKEAQACHMREALCLSPSCPTAGAGAATWAVQMAWHGTKHSTVPKGGRPHLRRRAVAHLELSRRPPDGLLPWEGLQQHSVQRARHLHAPCTHMC